MKEVQILRIDKELLRKFKTHCVNIDRTYSDIVSDLMQEYLLTVKKR